MSELLRGVVQASTVNRANGDGALIAPRAWPDGSLVFADFVMASVLEGRAFIANVGTVTTPITFGGGATITTTAPDFDLSVPVNTLVIPLEIVVYAEAFGTNAQFECMAAMGTGGAVAAATAVTPANLRADAPNATTCTARRTSSGATYQTGNVSEFWRDGQQFAITKTTASATASVSDPNRFVWKWSDASAPPMLFSTSAISRLNVFVAGQAPTGFITVKWLELPVAAVG